MKKIKYIKPTITSNNQISNVIPAAVLAAFPALAGGMALGISMKKLLSGNNDLTKGESLVDKEVLK